MITQQEIGDLRNLRKRAMPGPVKATGYTGYFGAEGISRGPSIRFLGDKRQENQAFVVAAFNVFDRLLDELNRVQSGIESFDLGAHLRRQRDFSEHTFGPGARTEMVLNHITKEITEVLRNPSDLDEWVDIVLLALDGAWRTGATPEDICAAIAAKQERNEGRRWPDWRTSDPNKAIEHIR